MRFATAPCGDFRRFDLNVDLSKAKLLRGYGLVSLRWALVFCMRLTHSAVMWTYFVLSAATLLLAWHTGITRHTGIPRHVSIAA